MSNHQGNWPENSSAMKFARSSSKAGLDSETGNCSDAPRKLRKRAVFVTADQNLAFQQNLSRSSLRVIVVLAPSNALEDLLPLVPGILRSIPDARPGQVLRVDG